MNVNFDRYFYETELVKSTGTRLVKDKKGQTLFYWEYNMGDNLLKVHYEIINLLYLKHDMSRVQILKSLSEWFSKKYDCVVKKSIETGL